MQVEDFTLTFEGMWAEDQPQRFQVGATLAATKNGRGIGDMEPRLNYYPTQEDPVPTPAVRSRMTDLYIVLMAFQPDGSQATIQAIVEPLVIWIWVGGVMIALGASFGLVFGMRKETSSSRRASSSRALGAPGPEVDRERQLTSAGEGR
jgi:cytochrome c-type biogenesis protein CcmF